MLCERLLGNMLRSLMAWLVKLSSEILSWTPDGAKLWSLVLFSLGWLKELAITVGLPVLIKRNIKVMVVKAINWWTESQ